MLNAARETRCCNYLLLAVVFATAFALIACDSRNELPASNQYPDLMKRAESGEADAQIQIADMLLQSSGVEKDHKLAIAMLEKASSQGNVEANLKFGELYKKGSVVRKDSSKAFAYYQKAVIAGDANAQYEVGRMYAFGIGTTADAKKAIEHLEASWTSGVADSAAVLGYMYEAAWGVKKDSRKAVEWYEKGVEKNSALALTLLGAAYLNGEGVAKDAVRSMSFFERAAAKADPGAHYAIGTMYRDGNGVTKDAKQAAEWFERAAALGHASAMYLLGHANFSGDGVPKNVEKAADLFLRGAIAGDVNSQRMYGWMSFKGEGIQPNKVIGYAWTNIAAAKGLDLAVRNRARFESEMTPEEISEAQSISSEWIEGMALTRVKGGNTQAEGNRKTEVTLTKHGVGTAFVVSKAGFAVTNSHVIQDCIEVKLEGSDGVVKVKASDKVNDLALVALPRPVSRTASILSDSSRIRQGDDVAVFGFPLSTVLSSGGNLTLGVVSALTGLGNNTNQIQITAAIQPGSSGSPVLNRYGEVVGVVAMKISDSQMAKATGQVAQNINFAIGAQTLKEFLRSQEVEFSTGYFKVFDKSNADLADEARKWTFVIECWK